jgi:hypothetical protein
MERVGLELRVPHADDAGCHRAELGLSGVLRP